MTTTRHPDSGKPRAHHSCVGDTSRSFSAAAPLHNPSGDQLRVGASVDQQFCGLPVPWLIQSSLGEADHQARGLGEQIGTSSSYLVDAGQRLSFLRLGEGAASRVALRRASDSSYQNPLSVGRIHPVMIEHRFESVVDAAGLLQPHDTERSRTARYVAWRSAHWRSAHCDPATDVRRMSAR
jgi:hypothetical protein